MGTLVLACPLCCMEKFSSPTDLKRHLLNMMDNLSCTGCGEKFNSIPSLAEHIAHDCEINKNTHGGDIPAANPGIEVNEGSLLDSIVEVKEEIHEEDADESEMVYIENIKIEEVKVNLGTEIKTEDAFFCSSCKVNFQNVEEHFEFHEKQRVLKDGVHTTVISSKVRTGLPNAETSQEEKRSTIKCSEFDVISPRKRALSADRRVYRNPKRKLPTESFDREQSKSWPPRINQSIEANDDKRVIFYGKRNTLPSTSLTLTPPTVSEAAALVSANLLPEKSRKAYLIEYETFNKWRNEKKVSDVSESVLLAYFSELSEKYKPSTLWRTYSILKSILWLHVKIEKYEKLQAFLKRKSEGFEAKKASVFTPEEVQKFINTASNELYLPTKVALIMGVMGACRSGELYNMKLSDIEDVGKACIIKIPNTKSKVTRTFTIVDNFYDICKQYINNRSNIKQDFVFLQYRKGKCTNQRVGINSFIKMGKDIAKFLELPNAETYSGHSLRKSSATILIDAEGDLQSVKRHGGGKSSTVAEGYVDNSIENKMDTEINISDTIIKTEIK